MKNWRVITVMAGLATGQLLNISAQNQPGTDANTQPPARRLERLERRERPNREGALAGEGLTEEQRQKVREATEKSREEQRVASEKLREARRELEQAAQGEEIDEAKIRAKAQVVGQLEGDMAIIRAKQYKELRKILPKEQVDRLQQAGGAGGRFGGAAGGGGRPGRPEGRQLPPSTTPAPAPTPQP
jgi:Spy/CpxP family protein refolding chaperone